MQASSTTLLSNRFEQRLSSTQIHTCTFAIAGIHFKAQFEIKEWMIRSRRKGEKKPSVHSMVKHFMLCIYCNHHLNCVRQVRKRFQLYLWWLVVYGCIHNTHTYIGDDSILIGSSALIPHPGAYQCYFISDWSIANSIPLCCMHFFPRSFQLNRSFSHTRFVFVFLFFFLPACRGICCCGIGFSVLSSINTSWYGSITSNRYILKR